MRYLIHSCTKVLQWFSSKLAKCVAGRFSVSPHDNHNKCCENSRSQIVFRTDIFRKLTLGAPDKQTSYSKTSKSAYRVSITSGNIITRFSAWLQYWVVVYKILPKSVSEGRGRKDVVIFVVVFTDRLLYLHRSLQPQRRGWYSYAKISRQELQALGLSFFLFSHVWKWRRRNIPLQSW